MGRARPGVLAIDAGSSRLRASLVCLDDGSIVASSATAPASAGTEADLERVWDDLVATAGSLGSHGLDLVGVGVSAQLGFLVVDEDARALGPVLLWGDRRAAGEADELRTRLGPDAPAVIGRRVTAELAAPKMRWMRRADPSAWRRARWMLSLKDALVLRLTGVPCTDATHASYSGLFDVRRRVWSRDLVAAAELDQHLLAPVHAAPVRAGGVVEEVAEQLGVRPGTPVAVGGPDGTIGAVGAGAVSAGVTVDIAGTTDVLVHTLDRPLSDPEGVAVLNVHAVPGLWTAGGPTGLTGGAIEWTARLLGFASVGAAYETLGAASDALRAAAQGPVFLAALAGSRFPAWRSDEFGALVGLRPEHHPVDVFGAAQQAAAFTVAEGLDALRRLGAFPDEIVVAGGLAARTASVQLRCDAWDAPVRTLADREATTIGAAMTAAVAAGAVADLRAAAETCIRVERRYEPRPDVARALTDARGRWRQAGRRLFEPDRAIAAQETP